MKAARAGDIAALETLIEQAPHLLNARCRAVPPFHTLLTEASYSGQKDAVALLLERGADPDATDDGRLTPLIRAALRGHVECIRVLIDGKATIDKGDMYRNTPLILAAQYGHVEAVRTLCDGGADINWQSSHYWSPIATAAYCGKAEVVKLLASYGASREADPEKQATIRGFHELATWLRENPETSAVEKP